MFIAVAMLLFLAAPLWTTFRQSQSSDKPEALIQAELARDAIKTARIDWSGQFLFEGGEAGQRTHFYTWRCAGRTCTQELCGDDEGVYMRGEGQQPLAAKFQNPEFVLTKDGRVWNHEGRSPIARVWDDRDRFKLLDFRALGLNPSSLYRDFSGMLASAQVVPDYTCVVEVDGVYRVTAHTPAPHGDFVWWIDADREWNVVRTRVINEDGVVNSESEYELAQFDGRWFPRVIRQYRGAARDGDLFWRFIIIGAEFNRPDHPKELTPASIGIEPGMQLEYINLTEPCLSPCWDGSSIAPLSDFLARVRRGEATFGPTLLRERARAAAHWERTVAAQTAAAKGSVAWKNFESAWERYTREFIERYKLTGEQSQHAWTMCRECQNQAREYAERHREGFDKLDREPTDRLRTELLSPIDTIFEKRLKPRLNDIPTSAQRNAAVQAPPLQEPTLLATSQPSIR